jgi:hypothetical protein
MHQRGEPSTRGLASQKARLLHLSAETVRSIPPAHYLVMNLEEQIVTQVAIPTARITAQGRFPASAFRALVVLLKSPHGASYTELLAGLHCPASLLERLLVADQLADVEAFQEGMRHWQAYLARAERERAHDPRAIERELKALRWAVRGKRGLAGMAQRHGFNWRVRAVSRQGYQLLRTAPASPSPEEMEPITHL